MTPRLLPLLFLAACGMPNPMNTAQEDCERINAAAMRYFERCGRPPNGPLPNCGKVWQRAVPEEDIEACITQFDAITECGIDAWPKPCPKTWLYLPGT